MTAAVRHASISQSTMASTARAFDPNCAVSRPKPASRGQPLLIGIHASNRGRIMIFGRGITIAAGGSVVGAIGVSGGGGDQDQMVATAGASVFSN